MLRDCCIKSCNWVETSCQFECRNNCVSDLGQCYETCEWCSYFKVDWCFNERRRRDKIITNTTKRLENNSSVPYIAILSSLAFALSFIELSAYWLSISAATCTAFFSSTKYNRIPPQINRMLTENMANRELPDIAAIIPINNGPRTAANLPSIL